MGEFGGFEIFVVAALVLAIVLVFMGVKSVPQGMEWTVERFGRYTRTLEPGLQLITPFIDRIGAKLNMMETVLDVPSQEVIDQPHHPVQLFLSCRVGQALGQLRPALKHQRQVIAKVQSLP